MRIVLVLVVTAVAAAGWALYPSSRPQASELVVLRAQLSQLSEQVAALQSRCDVALEGARPASAARPLDRPAQLVRTAVQPLTSAPQATGDSYAPRPAFPIVDTQRALGQLFDEEEPDTDWAAPAEATIEQRLSAQLPPSSRIQSVHCHASMCRIETVHRDRASYQDALVTATKDPTRRIWSGDMASEEISKPESTEVLVVSYLSREGTPLPSF